ncbi:MAG: phosphonate ABC transporter, permease protein PhnE [Turicibacter sp.]|nr:phosphonate ABC transporter, permease protein PhnE [Turicibacter sp.]
MKLKDTIHRNLPGQLLILLLVVIAIAMSAHATGADFGLFIRNHRQMGIFMGYFMRPDWAFFSRIIDPMILTLRMAVVGTVLGSVTAIPLSFLATTIVTGNRAVTGIVRLLMNIIRTVPTLLLAALFVAIFGIGPVTGVLTLAVFSFGIMSKLMYDLIETIDLSPLEAAESVGANPVQIVVWSIVPQISHIVASYILYVFEINIRASTILGYVGAGGIGVVLNSALGLFRYDRVSVIILFILAVIFIVDGISEFFRRRLT